MAKLSAAELAKREDVIQKMKKNKRSLVKRYGPDAEKVMYGRATNIAKKVAETQMEKTNLKELVRAALMQEKKFPDLTGDGKVTYADVLKGRGVEIKEGPEDRDWATYVKSLVNDIRINGVDSYTTYSEDDFIADYEEYIGGKMDLDEDLDVGHQDDEPHMLKGDLYRIGKYAMELYQMVDRFEEMGGEVDFPHWWQSKIIKAKEMVSSAKHYLDFETKEPEIDAMVGAIDMSGALDNVGVDENQVDMFATKASRTDNAKETYFKFLKDFAKSAGVSGEELGKMSYNDLENKFGEKLARKYELKKSNVADRARELVSKGVIQVDEGLPKDYWAKKIPGGKMDKSLQETNENEDILGDIISDMLKYKTKEEVLAYLKQKMSSLDESYEALVKKIKGQGKSEKAAKAIAGAVASYKAKGGGKGPTAKQKARK
jgi:hypothetical protein